MAARYWVGGSGTWNTTNTTNWAASSGGAGGASVPTSADLAVFDTNSGSATVTLSGTLACSYIFVPLGFTGTIDFGSSTLHTYSADYGIYALNSACTLAFGTSSITIDADFGVLVGATNTVTTSTSSITMTDINPLFSGGGKTYNNLTFSSTALRSPQISGANTFNTLTVTGRTTSGNAAIKVTDSQTISTLNVTNGSSVRCRTFFYSDTVGTTRTLTVATCTNAGYSDFRDITISGAAAPISGTYLGDCGGNSGITFPAPKTSYYVGPTPGDTLAANAWSNTSTGAGSDIYFPLAQDTAVVTDYAPGSGYSFTFTVSATVSNFGTLDFSARTNYSSVSGTVNLYGDIVGGSGAWFTAYVTAFPRSTQTLSKGTATNVRFSILAVLGAGSGEVILADDTVGDSVYLNSGALTATTGTVSLSYLTTSNYGAVSRSIDFGSGVWSLSSSNPFDILASVDPAYLTVAGTGTISLTSASAKTFYGAGIQTWPTLDQGGAGALTVTGSSKFKNLTNSYGTTAATTIKFTGGTTNEFDDVNVYGSAGKLCTITSTNTTQITLKKGSTWCVGPDSVIASNSTGFLKTAGDGNYLSISYATAVPFAGGDMMLMFGY